MSESAVLWLFGTIIDVQTLVLAAMGSAIWTHVRDCGRFRVEQARLLGEISADLKRVKEDIGDHDSGLRGQVHQLASDISPYIVRSQHRRSE